MYIIVTEDITLYWTGFGFSEHYEDAKLYYFYEDVEKEFSRIKKLYLTMNLKIWS